MIRDLLLSNGLADHSTVTVDVTASTAAVHTNTSGDLTSSAGNSGDATANLTVDEDLPGFSKSFSPSSVPLGGRSTLTFTIDNPALGSDAEDLSFTDILPVGMVIADPANASFTDCEEPLSPATLTTTPGTSVISLFSNGSLGFPALDAGESCIVTVDVTATGSGMLDNVTGQLSIDLAPDVPVPVGKASATLEVTVTEIALSKSFLDDPVPPGGTVTLEFTISNLNRDFSATSIAFMDDLAGVLPGTPDLTVVTPLSTGTCDGSLVATIGDTFLTYSGGSLAPETSCTISVSVDVPAAAATGIFMNTTTAIMAEIDGSSETGNLASDDLFISFVPTFTKEFLTNPVGAGGTTTLRFTITNTSSTETLDDIAFEDVFDDVVPTASGGLTNTCGGTAFFIPFFDGVPPTENSPARLTLSGASLDPSETCMIDLTLDVVINATEGIYPNTTSLISGVIGGDEPVEGFPATDTLVVVGGPSLVKEFTDDPVVPGGTVTLEFTIIHDALAPATPPTSNLRTTLMPSLPRRACLLSGCRSRSVTGDRSTSRPPASSTSAGARSLQGRRAPSVSCSTCPPRLLPEAIPTRRATSRPRSPA